MRLARIFTIAAFGMVSTCLAQQATVKRLSAPFAGSVKLSDVDDKYNVQIFSREIHEPEAGSDRARLRAIKREVEQAFPRQRFQTKQKTTAAPLPTVAISYIADSSSGVPPDNDMAVSNGNKSVSVINSSIAVHNALTGQMSYKKGLKTFSQVVGLNSLSLDWRYDPKVIYDPVADRFICVMLNATDSRNHIVLAFSQTNDPAGAWNFYKFYGDISADTTWFDYPSIAITEKEFFLTGNKIRYNTSWQAGFKQTVVYQIRKQDGYDGDTTVTYQLWENIAYDGRNIRNLYPVKHGLSISGPEQYFLSNRNFDIANDTVFLVRLPDTIGSTNTNLTVVPLKSNLVYGVPPDGRQNDSFTLATNDGRILGAYRVNNEIEFVSTTVHPVSGSAAVYHGKIANFATSPALSASYFVVDTLDFGYPNVSYAGNYGGVNHSIISFNYTGPQTHAGIGAVYYDGTQYSDLLKVKQGDSSIQTTNDKVQRWGDYMGSQRDWLATGVVWIEGIYGKPNRDYGNYIAKLVSPFFSGVRETQVAGANGLVYPNPAFEFVRLDFELQQSALIHFSICDINGKAIDKIADHQCRMGNNVIQFNIASLTPGVYFLTGHSSRGQRVVNRQFVKQ